MDNESITDLSLLIENWCITKVDFSTEKVIKRVATRDSGLEKGSPDLESRILRIVSAE